MYKRVKSITHVQFAAAATSEKENNKALMSGNIVTAPNRMTRKNVSAFSFLSYYSRNKDTCRYQLRLHFKKPDYAVNATDRKIRMKLHALLTVPLRSASCLCQRNEIKFQKLINQS
jgi:hypothetical protein